MAKLNDITFNIGVSIPNDTFDRCCVILSMWLNDNPDKTLEVVEWEDDNGLQRALGVKEGEANVRWKS